MLPGKDRSRSSAGIGGPPTRSGHAAGRAAAPRATAADSVWPWPVPRLARAHRQGPLTRLSIVTMIGVGISIDYSLFVLFRFREELARARDGERPDAVAYAVGVALATSGRTIAFSGVIVANSLLSLFVVDSPLFHGIALGAVLVVLCTLVVDWTMLPALLAALGERVNRGALPRRGWGW